MFAATLPACLGIQRKLALDLFLRRMAFVATRDQQRTHLSFASKNATPSAARSAGATTRSRIKSWHPRRGIRKTLCTERRAHASEISPSVTSRFQKIPERQNPIANGNPTFRKSSRRPADSIFVPNFSGRVLSAVQSLERRGQRDLRVGPEHCQAGRRHGGKATQGDRPCGFRQCGGRIVG